MTAQTHERSHPPGYPAVGRYRHAEPADPALDDQAGQSVSDGEMYRWIRDNRGNYLIYDALRHSDRNEDFDARIRAAVLDSRAGQRTSYLKDK